MCQTQAIQDAETAVTDALHAFEAATISESIVRRRMESLRSEFYAIAIGSNVDVYNGALDDYLAAARDVDTAVLATLDARNAHLAARAALVAETARAVPVDPPPADDAGEDEDGYCECENCHERISRDDSFPTPNGDVCESCYEDYGMCDHCEETVCADELESVTSRRGDDIQVCETCRCDHYSRCNGCNAIVHDSRTIGTEHGSVCQSCYEDSYFTCDSCGDVFHNDDYGSDCRCQSCADDSDVIGQYGDDAEEHLGFIGSPRDGLWTGIELEVESSNLGEDAQSCHELLDGYAILKHDGSLDHGFEIVTAPADVETHRTNIVAFAKNRPRTIKSFDTTTCGMHVHVSRAPISQLTIGKIAAFLGAPGNLAFVEKIAQRPSGRWARIEPKSIANYGPRSIRYQGNRYQALNVSNSDTIEFRMFKGTLEGERILANLEFCIACVKFCQNAGIRELTADAFCAYVASAPKRFPHLASLLRQWEMIPAPRVKLTV